MKAFLVILAFPLAVLGVTIPGCNAAAADGSQSDLPKELANYREWPQLLSDPHPVPMELYIRCVAPTPKDWEAAEKKYGPHTNKYVRVYGNHAAVQAFREKRALPIGAIVAKEKLLGTPQGTADGIAFMVKRGTAEFSQSGGWEFLYFPSTANRTDLAACASCHHTARATDYVFGSYPRQ